MGLLLLLLAAAARANTAIVEDARAAQTLGLTGVPMVFVNGIVIIRWCFGEGPRMADRPSRTAGRGSHGVLAFS